MSFEKRATNICRFKEVVYIQDVIDLLNNALKNDPVAITALFEYRVSVNKKLKDSRKIQCSVDSVTDESVLSCMHVINSLFGWDWWDGPIGIIRKGGQIVEFFDLKRR